MKWFLWVVLLVLFLLRYVIMGVTLLQLWLAHPFVSGYNWTATAVYVVKALLMYVAGCFVNHEWQTLSAHVIKIYPEEFEEE
jgi:hypothetical protein